MRHLLTLRVGGKYLVVPKLIGAMLIVIAVLMFVSATVDVVTTWDKIKDVKTCVSSAGGNVDNYMICILKGIQAGVYVYSDEKPVLDDEVWGIMVEKAAVWLFWITVLVVAIVLFRTGKLMFPVEEEEVEKIEVVEEKKRVKRGRGRKKKSK